MVEAAGADWTALVENLSLVGALVIAVGLLWRAAGKKDAQVEAKNQELIAAYKATTEAMAVQNGTLQQLRESIDRLAEQLKPDSPG